MPRVFVAVGSNIDREKHIPQALQELRDRFGPLLCSSLYESEAEGFEGPPFYNLVVAFETDLPFEGVEPILKEIERRHGRGAEQRKFRSRTLDLDLLLYGDQVLHRNGRVVVPHGDILRYAFVLEPLAEIAPEMEHPLLRKSFAELWQAFDKRRARQKRRPNPWCGQWSPHPTPSGRTDSN